MFLRELQGAVSYVSAISFSYTTRYIALGIIAFDMNPQAVKSNHDPSFSKLLTMGLVICIS
jgi:hypothetical protein